MAKWKNKTPYRSASTLTLKDSIDAYLKAFRLQKRYDETYIIANWERLVGKQIASMTEKIWVNNKKIYLKVNSAPLRHELMLSRSKLIEILNRDMDPPVIEEILFI